MKLLAILSLGTLVLWGEVLIIDSTMQSHSSKQENVQFPMLESSVVEVKEVGNVTILSGVGINGEIKSLSSSTTPLKTLTPKKGKTVSKPLAKDSHEPAHKEVKKEAHPQVKKAHAEPTHGEVKKEGGHSKVDPSKYLIH